MGQCQTASFKNDHTAEYTQPQTLLVKTGHYPPREGQIYCRTVFLRPFKFYLCISKLSSVDLEVNLNFQ